MHFDTQKSRLSGPRTTKSFKLRENDVLAPILLDALPPAAQPLMDKGIPQFEPENRLFCLHMSPRVPIISPLQLFLLLLGEETLVAIVNATNMNAAATMALVTDFTNVRPRYPLTRNELIVRLGTLFFMGRHHEFNRCRYSSYLPAKSRCPETFPSSTQPGTPTCRVRTVCIDEANLQERSQQVQEMATIYRLARHVIVWPGPWLSTWPEITEKCLQSFNTRSSRRYFLRRKRYRKQ